MCYTISRNEVAIPHDSITSYIEKSVSAFFTDIHIEMYKGFLVEAKPPHQSLQSSVMTLLKQI